MAQRKTSCARSTTGSFEFMKASHKNTCHSEHYLRILLVSQFVDKRHRLLHS